MAGIYVHIPFCKTACHYCNFHFSTSKKNKDAYVGALIKEIEHKKELYNAFILPEFLHIKSLYFGGGTPSQLSIEALSQTINALYKNFPIATETEFTLEANPDDLNKETLKSYLNMGINRLSIGVQSFNTNDLLYLNRLHTPDKALNVIKEAQEMGFTNINIDLIYGIPTLTQKTWAYNLKTFLELDIPHLSAYCLTVEQGTPLSVWVKNKMIKNVDEAMSIAHYKELIKVMSQHQFEHYEISNFSKKEVYSKHNLAYWQQKPYLGLGASAHSFYKNVRGWNVANTSAYINKIRNEKDYYETEHLDLNTQYNEYLLLSLRTMWGCNLKYVLEHFGAEKMNALKKQLNGKPFKGLIIVENDLITLSEKGKLFADKIASDLFIA